MDHGPKQIHGVEDLAYNNGPEQIKYTVLKPYQAFLVPVRSAIK